MVAGRVERPAWGKRRRTSDEEKPTGKNRIAKRRRKILMRGGGGGRERGGVRRVPRKAHARRKRFCNRGEEVVHQNGKKREEGGRG